MLMISGNPHSDLVALSALLVFSKCSLVFLRPFSFLRCYPGLLSILYCPLLLVINLSTLKCLWVPSDIFECTHLFWTCLCVLCWTGLNALNPGTPLLPCPHVYGPHSALVNVISVIVNTIWTFKNCHVFSSALSYSKYVYWGPGIPDWILVDLNDALVFHIVPGGHNLILIIFLKSWSFKAFQCSEPL